MNTTRNELTSMTPASRAAALAASVFMSATVIGATVIGLGGCGVDASAASAHHPAATHAQAAVTAPSARTEAIVHVARLQPMAGSDETTITTMETVGASPRD